MFIWLMFLMILDVQSKPFFLKKEKL